MIKFKSLYHIKNINLINKIMIKRFTVKNKKIEKRTFSKQSFLKKPIEIGSILPRSPDASRQVSQST